ncbi:uncharacterized protein LOC143223063 isoform X2 [Tachypleus tridentatus]|uniref:uncharacterized protein LOC143223063 isoform X2 n=1 Tax=Tachypleus tridentatus TaxID=6853 RepID=UPI003FD4C29E
MNTHQETLCQDLGRLSIANFTPQQYSAARGKKIAPVVPPKPKKKNVVSEYPDKNIQQNVYPESVEDINQNNAQIKYKDVEEENHELVREPKYSVLQETKSPLVQSSKYPHAQEKNYPFDARLTYLNTQRNNYPLIQESSCPESQDVKYPSAPEKDFPLVTKNIYQNIQEKNYLSIQKPNYSGLQEENYPVVQKVKFVTPQKQSYSLNEKTIYSDSTHEMSHPVNQETKHSDAYKNSYPLIHGSKPLGIQKESYPFIQDFNHITPQSEHYQSNQVPIYSSITQQNTFPEFDTKYPAMQDENYPSIFNSSCNTKETSDSLDFDNEYFGKQEQNYSLNQMPKYTCFTEDSKYPIVHSSVQESTYPDVRERNLTPIQENKYQNTHEKIYPSVHEFKHQKSYSSAKEINYSVGPESLYTSSLQRNKNEETAGSCYQMLTSVKGGQVNSSYHNLPPSDDDLPPPPPPPPQTAPYSSSNSCPFPPPPTEEIHPPLSPTSSTYATQSTYATFRPQSPASTYDTGSIYESINPRPVSQMSSRSAYSTGSSLYSTLYPGGVRGKLGPSMMTQPLGRGPPTGQEAEVDHLTDLLVQSMENSGDPEFFGMCYKCGDKVLGEGSGCTAMDQVYHIHCFTCHVCQKELQGKSFYAMDGKPYCEEDYLNSLEKCCVCGNPILDRILRATGKPYHPACFKCVVCGKCLDGIPFTVDATNQIHCIDDFHKKFAPRCCVCKQPIMPEPGQQETVRVVALDRSFHVKCYRCEG